MKRPGFLILIFSVALALHAQPVKRLYIANDDHTDYMWTANEATYDSAFVQMLDFYLHQIDSTKNNPPDFQARYNCDGSYWIRAYQKYRSPAQYNRLIAAIRSGHLSSPLNSLVSTYGAQPTEAVLRGMYYAGQLEREHQLRFTLATAMENNTIPLGLSSLWAGSGAKYSWKGIGGYGSQMTYEYRANRRNQLYRYAGLDGSSVLMKWYNYNGRPNAHTPLGGYAECRLIIKSKDAVKEIGQIVDELDAFCDTLSPQSTHRFNVGGAFGWGHDDLATFISNPFIQAAQNGTNANRKVRVSNEEDFFQDVARTYPNLPAESLSYGNEWDLYCASMNETTAQVRRSLEKLRSAEALASIVALNNPNFAASLKRARQQAWEALGFYWEHNWTADGPVTRPLRAEWQIKLQKQLANYVDSLFTLSSAALGKQIKKSANPRFYVFNPLSWTRDDVADLPYHTSEPIKVIDLSNQREVSHQMIVKGGQSFLRIEAKNLPPLGYKVFEIRQGQATPKPTAATLAGDYFSNAYYKLRLSPSGAITECYDRLAGDKALVMPGKSLNDLGASQLNSGNPVVIENAGPVSVTLKAVSTDPILHTVRVTLYSNSPRIEVEDSIQANFKDVKTWSFAFDLKNQVTHHEELGAVLTAKKETRGGHYAAQNARYDWQTFNHFADLSESDYGITLSNLDCSFFKLGESSVDSLWENSTELHALAGGQVDKKREDKGMMGIFNQNGQTAFLYQFALSTHQSAFDPSQAMKFALAHQNPLVAAWVDGEKTGSSAHNFSLLSVNDPNVLLWSVKPAEEGIQAGLITRFWNFNATAASPNLQLSKPIRQAWHTSHVETNEAALTPVKGVLKLDLTGQQLKTYRLMLK